MDRFELSDWDCTRKVVSAALSWALVAAISVPVAQLFAALLTARSGVVGASWLMSIKGNAKSRYARCAANIRQVSKLLTVKFY